MIGVCDSGSGGLTVVQALKKAYPLLDIVYVGDLKNIPYGARSHEEIRMFALSAISLLAQQGARDVIGACNSVSAALHIKALDLVPFGVRFMGVVGSTTEQLCRTTGNILVCATSATVSSGVYEKAFAKRGKKVDTCAIPHLASLIEQDASYADMVSEIKKATAPIDVQSYQTIVLGCTHYPFARSAFEHALHKPPEAFFDPAQAVVHRAFATWNPAMGTGLLRFLITKDAQTFRNRVQSLFSDKTYTIEVV